MAIISLLIRSSRKNVGEKYVLAVLPTGLVAGSHILMGSFLQPGNIPRSFLLYKSPVTVLVYKSRWQKRAQVYKFDNYTDDCFLY